MRNWLLFVALVLLAFGPGGLQAQTEAQWRQKLFSSYDSYLWYPSQVSRDTYIDATDPNHQYKADLETALKSDPAMARYICALILQPFTPRADRFELRKQAEEACIAFKPSDEQLRQVEKVLRRASPPPPTKRELMARGADLTGIPYSYYFGDGIYPPPPADPQAWLTGSVSGRDYRKDVQAALDANPLLVLTVCESAERDPNPHPRLATLHATLLEVCRAFPDDKLEQVLAANHLEHARLNLQKPLNTALDEAATMSPSARRAAAGRLLVGRSESLKDAIRALALTPDDWRAWDRVLSWGGGASEANAAELRTWLDITSEARARQGSDADAWKRGRRAFLMLTGDFKQARPIAEELVARKDPRARSQDIIYRAMIDRILGSREAYEKAMAKCPDPDASYLESHGKPSRPEQYCDSVIYPLAQRLHERLGVEAPAGVGELMIATSRDERPVVASAVEPPRPPSFPRAEDPARSLTVALDAAVAIAATMTPAKRAALAAQAFGNTGWSGPISDALKVMALTPADDRAVWMGLKFASDEETRRLLGVELNRRSRIGPEAEDWKRARCAYLLYSGDFAEAKQACGELAARKDPEHGARDRVIASMVDYVTGRDDALTKLYATCKAAPHWGEDGDTRDYCHVIVRSIVFRAVRYSQRAAPQKVQNLLAESMHWPADWDERALSLEVLEDADPLIAEREANAMLTNKDAPVDARLTALRTLRWLADGRGQWQTALGYCSAWLAEAHYEWVSPQAAGWKRFADKEDTERSGNSDVFGALIYMSRYARMTGDFEQSRAAIEGMVMLALEGQGPAATARYEMLMLASAEVSATQRAEPLRIHGYLSGQPLDSQGRSLLGSLANSLSANGAHITGTSVDSPWDSPPTNRGPRLPPPPPGPRT